MFFYTLKPLTQSHTVIKQGTNCITNFNKDTNSITSLIAALTQNPRTSSPHSAHLPDVAHVTTAIKNGKVAGHLLHTPCTICITVRAVFVEIIN